MERECTKCCVIYPIESFHKKKGAKDGRSRTCKHCDYLVVKKSREKFKDLHTDYWLQRNYKISFEEFKAMEDRQKGCCAICGTKPDYRLCVDHRHDTGKVRGLLCRQCNRSIGQLGDTPEGLLRAYKYLLETH